MKIEEVMIKDLNETIDLLEKSAIERRKLTDQLLSILDGKNACIKELHDKIGQLERAIRKNCD